MVFFFFCLRIRENVNNNSSNSSNDAADEKCVPFSATREVVLIMEIIASI